MSDSAPPSNNPPPVASAFIDPSVYEAIFHASIDGILIADDHARYINVNDAACAILGRSREELIGQEVGTFVEYKEDARALWEKALRAGNLRAEITIVRPDGQRSELEFSGVTNIQPGRHMILIRDLTRRRNLEEQIRNASKMEAVGRLAGGVAHDFNNLLMVITSYTELMLDVMAENDPLRKKAQEVLNAAGRAASLTRQLLAFSRKQVLDPQAYEPNTLISEMSKLLVRVLGEDVELKLDLGEDLGRIYADRGQIEQILMHLAVNARDVMPNGGTFKVRTANAEFDSSLAQRPGSPAPGGYVMVAVEDSGTGMSKEVLAHLFEPFFSTKGMGKGTGLGLAAVYGIVKQSGGFIWVDSEVGKGSIFQMYFPRFTEAPKPRGAGIGFVGAPGSEIVVMLVEDEDALRLAAVDFLKTRGYTVLSASDGTEALGIASKFAEKIDVLVTDLVMPGISGRLLAQELVKLHPETRIMYMSGYSDDAVLEHAASEASSTLLRKPFHLDALSAKIRELLGK
jgi:two-component system cell cycle sensor histidine kinase/response regulator CckA